MRSIMIRKFLTFLGTLLLVLISESAQPGEPAQAPLYLSVIPGKPNIMLIIDTSGSMSRTVTGSSSTRMTIAQNAAKSLVDQLAPSSSPTVRLGLFAYNSGVGGRLVHPLTDLDPTTATNIKNQITALKASGVTPLATTLSDVGYYYTTGYNFDPNPTQTLTLPGVTTDTAFNIFKKTSDTGSTITIPGFDPSTLGTTTTTTCDDLTVPITPATCVIPVDGGSCQVNGATYNPPCTCSNPVAGGADTAAAASATDASNHLIVPAIQMLNVCPSDSPGCTSAQPVICTGNSPLYCSTQSNFNVCQCTGGLTPCGSCTSNTTGTATSINYSEPSTTPGTVANNASVTSTTAVVSINGLQQLTAVPDPDDSGSNTLSFTTTADTSSVCSLKSDAGGTTACTPGDRDCYIKGLQNGVCRVCTQYDGSAPAPACAWSSTSGSPPTCNSANEGSRYCPGGWSGNPACTSSNTSGYYVKDYHYTEQGGSSDLGIRYVDASGTDAIGGPPCSSTSDYWCDRYRGSDPTQCSSINGNHNLQCQQCACLDGPSCTSASDKYCSTDGSSCTAGGVSACYTATCGSGTCSNNPISCSQDSTCYLNTCDNYQRCSGRTSVSCSSNNDCYDNSGYYQTSCDNRHCSGRSSVSCSSNNDCYDNSGDYQTSCSYYHFCTGGSSLSCSNNNDCYDNHGDHQTYCYNHRCSNDNSVTCNNQSACNFGTCGSSSSKRCSNDKTLSCSNQSDCNFGTCGNGQCSNDNTQACTQQSNCNFGNCSVIKRCSNNFGTACTTAGNCNSGVSCGNKTCSDTGASCTSASTCPANSTVTCNSCSAVTPATCSCGASSGGTQCVVDTMDVQVGTGIVQSCPNVGLNGNTGGTIYPTNQCFNPAKYYMVQYNGSADAMGPYRGDQLNWYFQSHTNFTEGSLEIPPVVNQVNCVSTTSSNTPIISWCQKSFAVLVSDGLPNGDRNVNQNLRDYTGDCSSKGLCNSAKNTYQMPGTSTLLAACGTTPSSTQCNKNGGACNMACANGSKANRAYETGGSDYLDDVAKALYDMDLRPDLGAAQKAAAHTKNNLVTYTIGFDDPSVTGGSTSSTSVLQDAATAGGGKFYPATGATGLSDALNSVRSNISAQVGSSSSVATNSTQINLGAVIYQAKFDGYGWFGDLNAILLHSDGSIPYVNPEADPQDRIVQVTWDAAQRIPAAADRTILTYKPSTGGTMFEWANLDAIQQGYLSTAITGNTTTTGATLGQLRLAYLRGDKTHEEKNAKRKYDTGETQDAIRSDDPAVAIFRNRTRLDSLTQFALSPDPWPLGDIVNSNPVYVSNEDYGFDDLPEGGYSSFVSSKSERRKMIYVGANDGMLHGFDANKSGSTAGREIVAYIPNAVYGNFASFASPDYTHHYFVDGSPVVADAYFSGDWHTVLVGTTGAGAKSVFALDISDPGTDESTTSGFNGSSVLWEVSKNAIPPTSPSADLTNFSNNLGYTLSQASIVRTHDPDNPWVAVVANGYYSTSNHAVLYILDIHDGHIIRTIDAVSSDDSGFTSENGLSTPFVADIDSDRIADYIYAGDLRGNLWKFDVTASTAGSNNTATYNTNSVAQNWGLANSGKPLYTACDSNVTLPCPESNRQPITVKPAVGTGNTSGTYMVYFGTGKYFDTSDNTLPSQKQTFYGIVDKGLVVPTSGSKTRDNLVQQTTSDNDTFRTSSENDCAKDGWFMDLSTTGGERVVSFPKLHGGRIIFTTLVLENTSDDPCSVQGSGWLMELSALCGTHLKEPPAWPDKEDASGIKSDVGIPTAPGIIDTGTPGLEVKYISGSSGRISATEETKSDDNTSTGRQTWSQIR